MREGWEYRKLGDICTIRNGKDHKAVNTPDGIYPIYGSGGIMGYANSYLCEAETTIIGRKGSINNPIFVDTKFWNVDTAFGLCPNEDCVPRFLFYTCKSIDFTNYNKSTTLPSLLKSDLLKIGIPVPPLPEQERIVAELDLLSGIIEKQKAVLKDLDTLSQSIFYEMFGDPVTNDKGWEVKTLLQVSTKKGTYGAASPSSIKDPSRPRYVRITDIDDFGELNDDYVVSSNVEDDNNYLLQYGDLLFARTGATVGKTYLYRSDAPQIYAGYLIKFSLTTDSVCPLFIYHITKSIGYKAWVKKQMAGAAQPNINAQKFGTLPIILPPLTLQQSFAQKIEAVEKQKELMRKSLAETETLFKGRMSYYFD